MAARVIGCIALSICQLASATSDLRKAAVEPELRTEVPEIYGDANPYNKAPRDGVDPKFDCAWRRAAFTYGKKIQPNMTTKQLSQLSDALQLGRCPGGAPLELGKTEQERRTFPIADGSTPVFVDPSETDSLHTALAKARAIAGHVTLALLPGVHRLTKPLLLSPADSNTTIQSHMGGDATLTGAKILPALKWEKYKVATGANATNIWKASVPASAGVRKMTGLRLSGGRGQRARYPNANSETDQFPTGERPLDAPMIACSSLPLFCDSISGSSFVILVILWSIVGLFRLGRRQREGRAAVGASDARASP